MTWQPIESAPIGVHVLVYSALDEVRIGYRHPECLAWFFDDGDIPDGYLTYWQPLPEPPAD